jgi:hypothetical protein
MKRNEKITYKELQNLYPCVIFLHSRRVNVTRNVFNVGTGNQQWMTKTERLGEERG